jgi:hypothetical protein
MKRTIANIQEPDATSPYSGTGAANRMSGHTLGSRVLGGVREAGVS